MDVPFPSLEVWESAAAIGSNMFEGCEPNRQGIEIICMETGSIGWAVAAAAYQILIRLI